MSDTSLETQLRCVRERIEDSLNDPGHVQCILEGLGFLAGKVGELEREALEREGGRTVNTDQEKLYEAGGEVRIIRLQLQELERELLAGEGS